VSACLYRRLTEEDARESLFVHEAAYKDNIGTCDYYKDVFHNKIGKGIGKGIGDISETCLEAFNYGQLIISDEQAKIRGICPKTKPDCGGGDSSDS
jgi:hypothetical protein